MADWSEKLKARAIELANPPAVVSPPATATVASVRDARLELWDRRGRYWDELEPIPWPVGSIGDVQMLPRRRLCRCGRFEALCAWLPFCERCAGEMGF